MYRYPTENIFDEDIDCILSFLFEYQSAEQKTATLYPCL